ncbi:MAG TPA: hypothetical protein VGJ94_15795 [Syntrophorhabdaceae bacterium]|jgi:hypothetical protein
MKNFFMKVVFFSVLVALSFFLLSVAPLRYGYHFASIINKNDMVSEFAIRQERLIVFSGGSGLWSGLDSSYVQKETEYNVANIGLFAGFGLTFAPMEAMRFMRAKDVLVLVPEYGLLYDASIYPNKDVRKWCFAMSPRNALKYLYKGWLDIGELLPDVASLCQYKIVGLARAMFTRPFQSPFGRGYINYSLRANKFGDSKNQEFISLAKERISGYGSIFPADGIDPAVYMRLNDLAATARARGITVILCFCAIPSEEYRRNQIQLDRLYISLKKNLNMPILGTPHDFTLDYRYFSNTIYHLTAEGKSVRTEKLTGLLNRYLKNSHAGAR